MICKCIVITKHLITTYIVITKHLITTYIVITKHLITTYIVITKLLITAHNSYAFRRLNSGNLRHCRYHVLGNVTVTLSVFPLF